MDSFCSVSDSELLEEYLKKVQTELVVNNDQNHLVTKKNLYEQGNINIETDFQVNGSDSISENLNIKKNIEVMLKILAEFKFLKEKYSQLESEVQLKVKDFQLKTLEYEETIQRIKTENISLVKQVNTDEFTEKESIQILKKTIENLEKELLQQKCITNDTIDKLSAHDAAAKRAISIMQKENGTKIDQITKMYDDCQKEKEDLNTKISKVEDEYIIKISKLESIIEDLQKCSILQIKKTAGQSQEVEKLRSQLKSKESDLIKLTTINENLENQVSKLNKKIDQQKQEIDGYETKINWAQNKLKTELEAHKDSKKQISILTAKLQESKEEGSQIRQNCQEMIERYQANEEIESVRLKIEAKEKDQLINEYREIIESFNNKEEQYKAQIKLLERKSNDILEENLQYKDMVLKLNENNLSLENILHEKEKDCAEMKCKIDELNDKLEVLNNLKNNCTRLEKELLDQLEQDQINKKHINELENEIAFYKEKQQELMAYTQSLTENNVASKSKVAELLAKQIEKEDTLVKQNLLITEKEAEIKLLVSQRNELLNQVDELKQTLDQKNFSVIELSDLLNQANDDLKIIKKKNAAQLKDLQKHLSVTTKKIDKLESGSTENLHAKSNILSNGSLEKLLSNSPQSSSDPLMISDDHYISQPRLNRGQNRSVGDIEIDKQVLIERICKLQRIHAKRNEKIDFLNEHILHLTEDLQKKSRIIQFFLHKEEAGSLSPNLSDKIKAKVSQHGGVMASVYSARPNDKAMTLELSLQINNKLQAVLEDTILKNIMLKENLDTLGSEIDKLQNEMRSSKK
ncbi:coiled-coil domain-containing protein 186-like [Hydra vulgaris]|uniref:Coiled-coil domain-containing protein 186-like n=1 Tax=Hydra vulgaris TaxID=6087 RepID=A0ABM4BW65_HYDVU